MLMRELPEQARKGVRFGYCDQLFVINIVCMVFIGLIFEFPQNQFIDWQNG